MPDCKDCLHYEVCADFRRNICEIDQRRFEEYKKKADGLCDNFKNKACFVELPRPVDHEALFAIVDLYNRTKIVGQTIAKYEIDCIIIGHSQKPIYRCCNASNEWTDFDGDDIGKTVFLTREEAEAALKERGRQ